MEIADRLQINNLKGFYDVKKIELGDKIKSEVLFGAAHSLVFVQLAERAMLAEPPAGDENWCFREFEHYRKGDDAIGNRLQARKRLYAFLVGDDATPGKRPAEVIRPAFLPDDYEVWFQEMLDDRVETLDQTSPLALRKQIDLVAGKIVRFREEVLDWVVEEEFVFDG